MVLDLRSDMFDHAQKLSLAFHDTESKGILMYRINNQAAAMGQIVVQLPVVAQNLLTVIGMAYISFRINPLLAAAGAGHHAVRRLLDHLLHRAHRAAHLPRARPGGAESRDRLRGDDDDARRPRLRDATTRMEALSQAGRELGRRDGRADGAPDGLQARRTADHLRRDGGCHRSRRLPGREREDHRRRTARGPLLHHPDLPAARGADQHDHVVPAAVHRPADVLRPDGHEARGHAEIGRAVPEEGPRGDRARRCRLRLREAARGIEGRLAPRPARTRGGDRRPDGRGQIDARQPPAAVLRRERGQRADRRS